jgi:hypothetical protein
VKPDKKKARQRENDTASSATIVNRDWSRQTDKILILAGSRKRRREAKKIKVFSREQNQLTKSTIQNAEERHHARGRFVGKGWQCAPFRLPCLLYFLLPP